MNDPSNAAAVEVSGLSRRFRTKLALDNVTLNVPQGCVFGLLGENGAGKTTLIKHLMGLLVPQSGTVRVFGHEPAVNPEAALGYIGYLSEDRDIPRWMRVYELMRYTQGFYPAWDERFAEELLRTFELDPSQKIKTLSLGQTAKTGLLCALAHRPPLVVLDEPSSGLDAVVRRHILHSAIRHVAEEGRTVLFSSHLLDEVERVSDYIAIMHSGKLLLCDKLTAIRDGHRRLTIVFDAPQAQGPATPGILEWEGKGKEWKALCTQPVSDVRARLATLSGKIVEEAVPSLEEIFLARVGKKFDDAEAQVS